jgi:outer membrane usher protein FimD/PapC
MSVVSVFSVTTASSAEPIDSAARTITADGGKVVTDGVDEKVYSVMVQGLLQRPMDVVLIRQGKKTLLNQNDLKSIGLGGIQGWQHETVNGSVWIIVESLSSVQFNETELTATITFQRPELLPKQIISAASTISTLPTGQSDWGAFSNYRVYTSNSYANSRAANTSGAFFEMHVTAPDELTLNAVWGVNRSPNQTISQNSIGALTLEKADTANRRRLLVGTGYSTSGFWGNSAAFIGIQYRNDDSLSPGFLTHPGAVFSGIASTASTAQLYLNDRPFTTVPVAAGPFELRELYTPYTAGGQLRAEIRGLDGKLQIINVDIIGAPFNLREGLSAFSYEIGAQRTDSQLGTGHPVAAATYAYGVSDLLTLEGHAEYFGPLKAGLAATYASKLGAITAALATGTQQQGVIGKFRYVYSTPAWSVGLSGTRPGKSQNFDGKTSPQSINGDSSWHFGKGSSINATYAKTSANMNAGSIAQPARSRASLGYSTQLSSAVGLSLSADRSSDGSKSIYLFCNVQLDGQRSLANTVRHSATTHGTSNALFTTLRSDKTGYTGTTLVATARASNEGNVDQKQVRLDIQHAALVGEFSATVESASANQRYVEVAASGAVALAKGRPVLTRRIDDSYAVVTVAGAKQDIGLQVNRQLMAHTDHRGVAVLPRIASNSQNDIEFGEDLPDGVMGAQIAKAIGYRYSPVAVNLGLQRPGVLIAIKGIKGVQPSFVTFKQGQRGWLTTNGYYVEDLAVGRQSGTAGDCVFEVDVPPNTDDIPVLSSVCLGHLP